MPVVTVIGAGLIGASWARLFAGAGWVVRLYDPRPDLDEIAARELAGFAVWVHDDLVEATQDAEFVQEAGPERIAVKQEIFAVVAALTGDDVVLASSSSSLLPSAIAEGNPAAFRILVGHPFNPPELMPLVEVVPGPQTSARHVDRATDVYLSLGKVPIRLKKEIPGFVSNRLQKAIAEESTYLVQQDVIDVSDLDELVTISLGLRWATTGPFESRHLGGGPAGIRHLIEHVGSQLSFATERPDPRRLASVIEAVERAYGTDPEAYRRLAERRDRRIRAVLAALGETHGTENSR